jgi:hypothetical protein
VDWNQIKFISGIRFRAVLKKNLGNVQMTEARRAI